MHSLHVVFPSRSWNLPASQLMQTSALAFGLKVPGAHGVGDKDPGEQALPGGHGELAEAKGVAVHGVAGPCASRGGEASSAAQTWAMQR